MSGGTRFFYRLELIMVVLKNYDDACEAVFLEFLRAYFPDNDYFFVSDDPTGVLCVNDYYFGINDALDALHNKATKDDVLTWYDYNLDCSLNNVKPKINFKNLIQYPSIRPNTD